LTTLDGKDVIEAYIQANRERLDLTEDGDEVNEADKARRAALFAGQLGRRERWVTGTRQNTARKLAATEAARTRHRGRAQRDSQEAKRRLLHEEGQVPCRHCLFTGHRLVRSILCTMSESYDPNNPKGHGAPKGMKGDSPEAVGFRAALRREEEATLAKAVVHCERISSSTKLRCPWCPKTFPKQHRLDGHKELCAAGRVGRHGCTVNGCARHYSTAEHRDAHVATCVMHRCTVVGCAHHADTVAAREKHELLCRWGRTCWHCGTRFWNYTLVDGVVTAKLIKTAGMGWGAHFGDKWGW
jgi:hypothetical protein